MQSFLDSHSLVSFSLVENPVTVETKEKQKSTKLCSLPIVIENTRCQRFVVEKRVETFSFLQGTKIKHGGFQIIANLGVEFLDDDLRVVKKMQGQTVKKRGVYFNGELQGDLVTERYEDTGENKTLFSILVTKYEKGKKCGEERQKL